MPGPRGTEHLQVMAQAAGDINAAVATLHSQYGPIFAFGWGPLRFAWLVGADANRFVLEEAAPHLTLGPAYGFLRTIGGDTALITSDEPEHLRRRRLVQPAFHKRQVAALDAVLDARLREVMAGWSGHTIDLYAELKQHVLELICETLLGERARRTPLTADIARMMAFANLPMPAQLLKVPLPGTPWARFLAARRRADQALYREIEQRRASDRLGQDVLGLLLSARDEAGQGLSDLEIRDQAISLVSAGFETTSAALTWAVYELLRHPELGAQLRAALNTSLSTSDDPPLLHHVVKETLRLYPPAPVGLRQAARTLTFQGYTIPKGHLLAFSIYAAHRSDALFDDAAAFKPERWATLTPQPYSYLPFGSGARYCIGAGLATRIITLGLRQLVANYDLTPAWTEPVLEAGNTLHPKGGLRVGVQARA